MFSREMASMRCSRVRIRFGSRPRSFADCRRPSQNPFCFFAVSWARRADSLARFVRS